jgi:acylphosphatase
MRCSPRTRHWKLWLLRKVQQTTIQPDVSGTPGVRIVCRQFKVSGRVQGVFFRASTRDRANGLQVSGQAINLPDGDVEVLACGTSPATEQLHEWLHRGPPMASVTKVAEVAVSCANPDRFTIA